MRKGRGNLHPPGACGEEGKEKMPRNRVSERVVESLPASPIRYGWA